MNIRRTLKTVTLKHTENYRLKLVRFRPISLRESRLKCKSVFRFFRHPKSILSHKSFGLCLRVQREITNTRVQLFNTAAYNCIKTL